MSCPTSMISGAAPPLAQMRDIFRSSSTVGLVLDVHTHTNARARAHTHTHSLSLSLSHTHTHARTHAHKHTNAQKRTHAHLKIRMFRRNVWHLSRSFSVWCSEKCAGVCVCVCVCACVRVCVCVNASHDNSVVGEHRARYRNPRRLRRFFLAGFVCQV